MMQLKKILNVAVLNRHGMKISHIALLTDQELKEAIFNLDYRFTPDPCGLSDIWR